MPEPGWSAEHPDDLHDDAHAAATGGPLNPPEPVTAPTVSYGASTRDDDEPVESDPNEDRSDDDTETDDDRPARSRNWLLRQSRETRLGMAALLSFLVLATVLVVNKGRGKSKAGEEAQAKTGTLAPIAQIEPAAEGANPAQSTPSPDPAKDPATTAAANPGTDPAEDNARDPVQRTVALSDGGAMSNPSDPPPPGDGASQPTSPPDGNAGGTPPAPATTPGTTDTPAAPKADPAAGPEPAPVPLPDPKADPKAGEMPQGSEPPAPVPAPAPAAGGPPAEPGKEATPGPPGGAEPPPMPVEPGAKAAEPAPGTGEGTPLPNPVAAPAAGAAAAAATPNGGDAPPLPPPTPAAAPATTPSGAAPGAATAPSGDLPPPVASPAAGPTTPPVEPAPAVTPPAEAVPPVASPANPPAAPTPPPGSGPGPGAAALAPALGVAAGAAVAGAAAATGADHSAAPAQPEVPAATPNPAPAVSPTPLPTPQPQANPASSPAPTTAPPSAPIEVPNFAPAPSGGVEPPAAGAGAGPGLVGAAAGAAAVGAMGAAVASQPGDQAKPARPEEADSANYVSIPTVGKGRSLHEDESRAVEPPAPRDPIEPVPAETARSSQPAGAAALDPDARGGAAPEAEEAVLHTVERGENFWTISQTYYGSGRYYKALWWANRQAVSAPDKLYVGQAIRIPPPEALDRSRIEPARTRTASSPSPTSRSAAPVRRSSTGNEDEPGRSGRRTPGEIEVALPTSDPLARRRGERPGIDDRARDDENEPVVGPAIKPQRIRYRVRSGETLRSIARDTLGDSHRADEILDLNSDVIDNPNRLTPGQVIELPSDARVNTRRAR